MKHIEIYFSDLSKEKQDEINEAFGSEPFDFIIKSLTVYRKEDLLVDAEEAQIEKDLEKNTIH